MPPTLNEVHVDRALTNLAIDHNPQNFVVADSVFPNFNVADETGILWTLDRTRISGDHAQQVGNESIRAEDGSSRPWAGWVPTQSTYRVEEYARHKMLFDRVVRKSDSVLQLRRKDIEGLTEILRRERELRAVTLAANGANWGATSVFANWTLAATDIRGDIDTAKKAIRKATLGRATASQLKVLMSWELFLTVRNVNTELKEAVKYTQTTTGRDLTVALLAAYLDVGEVVISGAYFNDAGQLLTENLVQFWQDADILVIYQESPSQQYLGAGLTMTTMGAGGIRARTWRDNPRKGEVNEVEMGADERIMFKDSGYLGTGATS